MKVFNPLTKKYLQLCEIGGDLTAWVWVDSPTLATELPVDAAEFYANINNSQLQE